MIEQKKIVSLTQGDSLQTLSPTWRRENPRRDPSSPRYVREERPPRDERPSKSARWSLD